MANSLTTSIMRNLSKKSANQNLDKNHNKVSGEKEISNLKRNEEEILLAILYKGRNKVKLNYSYKEENKNANDKKSIKDLIKKNDRQSYDSKLPRDNKKSTYIGENKSNIKIQSIKNLANSNTSIIKEESNNKHIKKITSLRDLAK